MDNNKLISELNNALSLELRAIILYSHYAAYVKGIHRKFIYQHTLILNQLNLLVMPI